MTLAVGAAVAAILFVSCIAAFGGFDPNVLLAHPGLTLIATAAGHIAGRHVGQMIAYNCLALVRDRSSVAIRVTRPVTSMVRLA
jgi:hypothetical protein